MMKDLSLTASLLATSCRRPGIDSLQRRLAAAGQVRDKGRGSDRVAAAMYVSEVRVGVRSKRVSGKRFKYEADDAHKKGASRRCGRPPPPSTHNSTSDSISTLVTMASSVRLHLWPPGCFPLVDHGCAADAVACFAASSSCVLPRAASPFLADALPTPTLSLFYHTR